MSQSTDPQRDLASPPLPTFRLFSALRSRVLRLLGRHVALVVDGSDRYGADAPSDRGRLVNRGYRARSRQTLPQRPDRRRRSDVHPSPSPLTSQPASPMRCSECGAHFGMNISSLGTSMSVSGEAHVRLVEADTEPDNPPPRDV